MKIQNVLSEDMNGVMGYKNLSPLQLGILRKISVDHFDIDQASPQAADAVEVLIGLGLVDDISYNITDIGSQALQYATKLGGSVDRRQLGAAKTNFRGQSPQQDVNVPDQPFDID